MSWEKGQIRKFAGNQAKHKDVRKICTREGQDFNSEMFYFRVSLAREAGYPDSALEEGLSIEFEPDPHAERPRVLRFKPYEGGSGDRPRSSARANGTKFLNPYHFIPLVAPSEKSLEVAESYLREAPLHDRFAGTKDEPKRFSGRVVCRLTTEGPVVIGAKQCQGTSEKTGEVEPFKLPDPANPEGEGRPAIPGSTLRGLISSIVEAASCSAMRVLSDATYSRRADYRTDALSAVGRIERVGGALKLRPLTLSLHEMQGQGPNEPDKEKCRVFLNCYRTTGAGLAADPKSFLSRPGLRSHSSSNPEEYWYLDLGPTSWHWDKRHKSRLGLDTPEAPLTEREWQDLPDEERNRFTRGVLMILGLDGSKAANLPHTKKHEYFLPFPDPGSSAHSQRDLLDIAPEALEDFAVVAQSAALLARGGDAKDFPYLPAGRSRSLELAEGDLVYHECDPATRRVTKLAFSAIWRHPVRGTLFGAIQEKISPDLVPFHRGRSNLTLAERLFGFVEHNGKKALCGRVRFSHGLAEGEEPADGWYGPAVPLKILASPKPPSPALYFGNAGYLAKGDLDLTQHVPQGRKVYLHHREADVESCCYRTADARDKSQLKMEVTPLPKGRRFLFHVDFHNLTEEELGHLLYALRPTPALRHKLGLGKPLGLGRVMIDPLGLFFIDRQGCYRSDGLFGSKYRAADPMPGDQDWGELTAHLAERYRHEVAFVKTGGGSPEGWPSRAALVSRVRQGIPAQVRWAIELVGDPAAVEQVGAEVTYPMAAGQQGEGEHYRWFVYNDDRNGAHEALEPLRLNEPLPTLTRHQKPERRK